jgi:signal transduction histidine kinase
LSRFPRLPLVALLPSPDVEAAAALCHAGAWRCATDRARLPLLLREAVEEARSGRASPAGCRALLLEANWGALRIAPDGRLLLANRAIAGSLGFPSPDVLEESNAGDFLGAEAWENLCRRADEGTASDIELPARTAEGAVVWLLLDFVAVRGADGAVLYYEGGAREVTRRRQLEEQLRRAQKMDAVGRLAGGITHDFNNLLAVINGYTELLLEQVPPDDARHATLRVIRQAGERSAALIRQLLSFARRQEPRRTVFQLNEVVGNLEPMLTRLVRADVALRLALDPELPPVQADVGQTEQVLVNLVINARDAMPRGGRLTLETGRAELGEDYPRMPGTPPGEFALLAVTDTGTGIDPQALPHIFEPFFTTKEEGQGTGLGLPTVYSIIQQNQGHIEVYSEPGRGTAFKVYIPLSAGPDRPAVPVSGQERRPSPGSETVLLVDDEPLVRRMIADLLRRDGYTVLDTGLPSEALEWCRQRPAPVDLLITDLVMPEMSGRELAEQFRGVCPAGRLLFMSGYTQEVAAQEGRTEPGDAFISKPFSPAALARKVREVLDAG